MLGYYSKFENCHKLKAPALLSGMLIYPEFKQDGRDQIRPDFLKIRGGYLRLIRIVKLISIFFIDVRLFIS